MAQHEFITHPLVIRKVHVTGVTDITPRMRRVTVAGKQLAAFNNGEFDLPGFLTRSFDDHVKLVFASDGDIDAALPVQRSRSIDWPPAQNRCGRDYTPRRWDPESGELDLDFVLHGHGPATQWAATAEPGDVLHFAGPKNSLILPEGIDWVLLAGDETALPAIGRYLDERPLDVPVQIVIEAGDRSARQELAVRDTDTIRWVFTGDGRPSKLAAAVQELTWWDGNAYAWAAAESSGLIPLRRWLRRDRKLPATHVNVTGYWHDNSDTADRSKPDLETLLSPLPWLAARAAFTWGLFDLIDEKPVHVAALADQVGVPESAVATVTTYLGDIDILVTDGDTVRLAPLGEKLLDDDHLRDELFGNGLEARTLHALTRLPSAARRGSTAWEEYTGHRLVTDIDSDPDLYLDSVEATGGFGFVAGGVADLAAWRDCARVTVTGPGGITLITAIAQRGLLPTHVTWSVPEAMVSIASDRAAALPIAVTSTSRSSPADLIVSVAELRHRTDADIVELLEGVADRTTRVLLIDVLTLTGPGGPGVAAEHNLMAIAGTGRGPRAADDIEALAANSGWRLTARTPLGWDYEVFELCR